MDGQLLMSPVSVTLSAAEKNALLADGELLAQAGFEVEDFGAGTVLVRSAPLLLNGQDAAESVMEIAGYLASMKNRMTTEHLDWVYHNVACRAAMKAGDSITREEMISLARELEEKNRALAREVPQALALIETAGSPALRCALHMVCMEGCGWDEVAARLGRGSADSWKKAVHRFCDARLEKG